MLYSPPSGSTSSGFLLIEIIAVLFFCIFTVSMLVQFQGALIERGVMAKHYSQALGIARSTIEKIKAEKKLPDPTFLKQGKFEIGIKPIAVPLSNHIPSSNKLEFAKDFKLIQLIISWINIRGDKQEIDFMCGYNET